MVLVMLKNAIMGSSGKEDRKALLPVARSYETVNNNDDDGQDDRRPLRHRTSCGSEGSTTLSESSSTSGSLTSGGLVPPRVLSDAIIGLSDGLTVPFALTAGLSSLGDSKIVITGGLAELVSGAISMGLGGYLAATSEAEYYKYVTKKEHDTFADSPAESITQLHEVLGEYKLSESTIEAFATDLQKDPKKLVKFILQIGHGLEEPAESRNFTSALTIGLAYFFGGFIPLIPYFFVAHVQTGLIISAIVMAITLFAFGVVKTVMSIGSECGKVKLAGNGVKMMLTGGIAAAAAWLLVRVIE